MSVNSQYFNKEAVEAGELIDFLSMLMKTAYGKSNYYNDIHISPVDDKAFRLDWVQVPWPESKKDELKSAVFDFPTE